MARGWESTSVESQMEETREQSNGAQHPLTEEEKNRTRERGNWMLARARVLHLLEAATNERYKELLRQELSELESKINRT
jgi:TATA-binding protein-associated factor Taf7